jgi:hypothetical protein
MISDGAVLEDKHTEGVDGRIWQMPISESVRSAKAIRRKLRALTAVFLDPAANEHEKANAKLLKERLETQVSQEATAEGILAGIMFRLGRSVKEITSPPPPKGDWTDHVFRLGRMFRRGLKR